jgi:hypothetical protein
LRLSCESRNFRGLGDSLLPRQSFYSMFCFGMGQAAIAQLVEQLTCNEKVQGSTPCGGTTLLGKRQAWALEG